MNLQVPLWDAGDLQPSLISFLEIRQRLDAFFHY